MLRVAGIDIHRCPLCGQGRLHVVSTLAPLTRSPAPMATGPPCPDEAGCTCHCHTLYGWCRDRPGSEFTLAPSMARGMPICIASARKSGESTRTEAPVGHFHRSIQTRNHRLPSTRHITIPKTPGRESSGSVQLILSTMLPHSG
jgi:hypothetical protein